MSPDRLLKLLMVLVLLITPLVALIAVWLPAAEAQQQFDSSNAGSTPVNWDAVTVQIRLGLRDTAPKRWEGSFTLSDGRVLSTDLLRRGAGDSLNDNRFQLQTRRARQGRAAITSNGLLITIDAEATTRMVVTTNEGEFRFALSDLANGKRILRLGGQVGVRRVPNVIPIAETGREEDYPAATVADNGSAFAVYVEHEHVGAANFNPLPREPENFDSYRPQGGGDRLMLTSFDGKQWQTATPVTDGRQDLWRPAIVTDGDGIVWTVWSQNDGGNWDLFARRYDPRKADWLGDARRLTRSPGADVNVALTRAASGNIWAVWQAWRKTGFDIHVAKLGGPELSNEMKLGSSSSNEWSPAITSDSRGNVFVAFDSYEQGNYDIQLATIRENQQSDAEVPVRTIASSPRFEVRPTVVCDSENRVWIAWEERAANWGKDDWGAVHAGPGSALYREGSTVRVACLSGDRLMMPKADLWENTQLERTRRMNGYPRLAVDRSGRVWLAMRHRGQRLAPAGTFWQSYILTFNGTNWSAPTLVPYSGNLLDNRPALLPQGRNRMLILFSGDGRTQSIRAPQINNNLYVAAMTRRGGTSEPELVPSVQAPGSSDDTPEVVHPREAEDVQAMRDYRFQLAGKTYQLLRGEFHRHTEISGDGGGDGSLQDMWRYGIDAARMDWIGNGDHDNGGGREYTWWMTQKTTDIYHHPPYFTPMFTYERSVRFPDGHRNVMFASRGVRPLPRLRPQQGESKPNNVSAFDTPMLYRYLKHFDGICAVHTSATSMGTDWRDNDPDVEPIVEIYQGDRHNYEHIGAPRSATEATQVGGYQPEGFVWNALEKGYRLGFQASSDHISTHISYAVAIVEQETREDILNAFKKRHCYGATDNIVLIVTCGDQMMGDEFSISSKPTLRIATQGTNPIARLSIVKDLKYVYRSAPRESQINVAWTDDDAVAGQRSLYYVRIEQEDGQVAWASPMWIQYEP